MDELRNDMNTGDEQKTASERRAAFLRERQEFNADIMTEQQPAMQQDYDRYAQRNSAGVPSDGGQTARPAYGEYPLYENKPAEYDTYSRYQDHQPVQSNPNTVPEDGQHEYNPSFRNYPQMQEEIHHQGSNSRQAGYGYRNMSYDQAGRIQQERRSYTEQPGYQTNPHRNVNSASNGFAIAGLILGIASVLLFWFIPISMPAAIAGIILSVIAMSRRQTRGLSIAGIITSIVGGFLSILAVVVLVLMLSGMGAAGTSGSDDEYFSPYPYGDDADDALDPFEDFFDNLR